MVTVMAVLLGAGAPLYASATPPPEAGVGKPAVAAGSKGTQQSPAAPAPGAGPLYIQEYRVTGARQLTQQEIGEAVYPFLGPGRGPEDVEQARAALEKAYKDKGFQTVTVQIPQQQMRGGVVMLEVVEATVGRLRVHGSRYFSLADIKKKAPSLAEGGVPNFNDITRDIVALNQLPDRRVTPSLRAGVEPGTVDIDLNVKDTPPLHGSVELNDRYSPNTTQLRLNGSLSYNNLWQLGHSLGVSFQIAPERLEDAKVFSGYYLVRLPNVEWLSLMLQGTKQDSNVSTLGGAAVAGRGEVIGGRAMITLPAGKDFFHSVSLGLDYKHFNQGVDLGTGPTDTPITYYPWSAAYSATWLTKGTLTEFNGALNFHLRGLGSDSAEFENNRFGADGSFIYFRGDLAHTHDLPAGFQVYAKVQGQIADQPLVSSEQFSGGGLSTARGYLESETPGDNAIFGSFELRSPSLIGWLGEKVGEWRIYAFADAGRVVIKDPLPEQVSRFDLASIGLGSRLRLLDHVNGSLDAALPLISQSSTIAHDLRLTFRVWADF
jgi:hemolysin activation/secretion protein